MRSQLLILLLSICSASAVYGQVAVSVGGFTGLSYSESSFESDAIQEIFALEPSWQIKAGFDLAFGLTPQATIHTGFHLVNKGIRAKLLVAGKQQELVHPWTTLEFPIAFSYRKLVTGNFYLTQRYGASFDIIESERQIELPPQSTYFLLAPVNERGLGATVFAGMQFEYLFKSGLSLRAGASYHQSVTGHFRKADLIYKTPDLSHRAGVITDGSYLSLQVGVQLHPAQLAQILGLFL